MPAIYPSIYPTIAPKPQTQWPSGRDPFHTGRWADKAIVTGPYYSNKVWWLDRELTIHWIATESAFQKWFGEKFFRYSDNAGFTGYNPGGGGSGYLQWLYARPVGANVDDASSPLAAFSNRGGYPGQVKGGYVLLSFIGQRFWLQPMGGWYLAHWVKTEALLDKYFGRLVWRYPPQSRGCRWPGTEQIENFPIGQPILS